jgi:hypothetical protein
VLVVAIDFGFDFGFGFGFTTEARKARKNSSDSVGVLFTTCSSPCRFRAFRASVVKSPLKDPNVQALSQTLGS